MDIFICVGSSCHLKGSKNIIDKLGKLIDENGISDKAVLKGSFCMGKCGEKGVSIRIDDEIYSIEEKDVELFFDRKILPVKNN